MHRIYLDNNAATVIDPEVLAAYIYAVKECWANPSSTHREGQRAKGVLEEARTKIASAFDLPAQQVVFFSSATEALNTTIKGLLCSPIGGHIITTGVEHAAVWETCRWLEAQGQEVSFLSVGPYGAPKVEDVERAMQKNTIGLVLMSVNNETGVKTDIEAMASLAESYRIPLIVDAVAQLGKEPCMLYPGIAAACFSSYKVHGPCGVGFALLNYGVSCSPLLHGSGQERGRRSGTENVSAIYACSHAVEICLNELPQIAPRVKKLRDRFERNLLALPGLELNGEGPRVGNTSNIAFSDLSGEELLIQLDLLGVAASHGAACSAGALEPSRVLLEMGYLKSRADGSVRFSLGKYTSEQDVSNAVQLIAQAVEKLRG